MNRCALALSFVLMVSGCASAPTRYYTLVGPDHPDTALNTQGALIVLDSVTIPQLVNRMQLVVEESDARVRILEHERWAAPLREQIISALIADLRTELETQNVIDAAQFDGRVQALHLRIDIERFAARQKGIALTAARWRLQGGSGETPVVGSATVSCRSVPSERHPPIPLIL